MPSNSSVRGSSRLGRVSTYLWLLFAAWTLVLAAFLVWSRGYNHHRMEESALAETQTVIERDLAFRNWATSHGGVYVPQTEQTPPSPYLAHIPERDLVTPSGRRLTLLNPAYILRQLNERAAVHGTSRTRITSLKPLRPANQPDAWERKALEGFETDTSQVAAFDTLDGRPVMRMMRPFHVEQGCMKCHDHQGYQVGDVRGGISATLPVSAHLEMRDQFNRAAALVLILLWLVGLVVISVMAGRIRHLVRLHQSAVAELTHVSDSLAESRQLFAMGPVVLFKWRNEAGWPVEHVSLNVSQVLGWEDVDFLSGRVPYANLIHPDDLARVSREVSENSASGAHRFEHEPYRLFHRDGSTVWVLDHTVIHRNAEGAVTHYIGYLVDITDLKNSVEALRLSEERLDLALDGADLGMWDWDITSDIGVFNERWATMLGYSLEEIHPHVSSWRALVHPDDQEHVESVLRDHLEGRRPFYQSEHRLRTKSGEWKWILDTGKVIARDAQGRPLRAVGIHQDITERKNLETQLVRQERLAAMGQLSAGIAHDFNNILAGILGFAELIQMTGDGNAETREHLRMIREGSLRASQLVRQILDFSRKTVRQPKPMDLNAFLEATTRFLSSTMPEHIQIQVDGTSVPCLIFGDATQLQQVMVNLAVNAKAAMMEGGRMRFGLAVVDGPLDEPCTVCGQDMSGRWACLTVSDTGCGIPADILPRVFEPFFTTKAVGEGSGLGLSQIAGIVAQHNGHITVGSRPGAGSTFSIYLPVLESGEIDSEHPPNGIERGMGETLLVVDDEPAVLQSIAMTMRTLGYQVLEASSGRQALEVFQQQGSCVDLVLSDVMMPDMSGLTLCARITSLRPGLPVVFMSGYPRSALSREESEGAGLSAWVSKPVSMRDLSQAVRVALDRRAAPSREDEA